MVKDPGRPERFVGQKYLVHYHELFHRLFSHHFLWYCLCYGENCVSFENETA